MSVLAQALLAAYAVPSGGGGDPSFASVSLLLHMDGTNGSTTFTDSSGSPKTMTAVGNAQISTAQSKFGGASGFFDGSGDEVTTPNVAAFRFGSADFTIEFWIRPALVNDFMHVIQTCNFTANQFSVRMNNTGKIQCFFNDGGNALGIVASTNSLVINTWQHVAVSRSGADTRIFIDGVQEAIANATYDVIGSTGPVRIGSRDDTASFQMNGYLDDMRVTTGVARYTANFTPPAAAFPNS